MWGRWYSNPLLNVSKCFNRSNATLPFYVCMWTDDCLNWKCFTTFNKKTVKVFNFFLNISVKRLICRKCRNWKPFSQTKLYLSSWVTQIHVFSQYLSQTECMNGEYIVNMECKVTMLMMMTFAIIDEHRGFHTGDNFTWNLWNGPSASSINFRRYDIWCKIPYIPYDSSKRDFITFKINIISIRNRSSDIVVNDVKMLLHVW